MQYEKAGLSKHTGVIYFDIGETLGAVQVDPLTGALLRIDVYPRVSSILQDLRTEGILIGIISNTGDTPGERVDDALAEAGILHYFDSRLRIYSADTGLRKDSTEIFELATGRAGSIDPDAVRHCVFVGESRVERQLAELAGMRTAPHPRLALAAWRGDQIEAFRLQLGGDGELARLSTALKTVDAVPFYSAREPGGVTVLLQGTSAAALYLQRTGFETSALKGAPAGTMHDYYLLRSFELDYDAHGAGVTDRGVQVCDDIGEGRIIALAPNASIDDFHCARSHGHNFKLLHDDNLLNSGTDPRRALRVPEPILSDEETAMVAHTITQAAYQDMLDRVTGSNPDWPEIGGNRHVLSGELDHYVRLLAHEFERIGQGRLQVSAHRFEITGREIKDVQGVPVGARFPVSNVIAELEGESDELVLVTAHLDSTAARSHLAGEYDPRRHPAPGVDDDGSGVAGVLLAAEAMLRLFTDRKPSRTLRFVLFTAEEQGLIGSERYARLLSNRGETIAGVFQMDMIGYNVLPPASFETHYGVSDQPLPNIPPVEIESRKLAELVAGMSEFLAKQQLSILEPVQLYGSPDGAAGRSDHASFQRRNYPACVTSEDFFPEPGSPEERNPNYHMATDLVVDLPYSTSITRVIAAAALRMAQPLAIMVARDEPMQTAAVAFLGDGRPATGKRTIRGALRDQATGAPLAQAKVTLQTFENGRRHRLTTIKANAKGQFSTSVEANRPIYATVHAKNGVCLDSTHEVPVPACTHACIMDLALDTDCVRLSTEGGRQIRLGDRWRSIYDTGALGPDTFCDTARTIMKRDTGATGTGFADGVQAPLSLCATEQLEALFALIRGQNYADEDSVIRRVEATLEMRDIGFAQQLHVTDNFEIYYYLEGDAAVEPDYGELVVYEPGKEDAAPIATLPATNVPAYVRLVGFWLERSLRTYTGPNFEMRNPASTGRLRAHIVEMDFGAATPAGFYIGNRLTPAFVCAVSVHELFHMIQYSYDGPGAWRGSLFEGGATFAEDFLADRMNRYLVEAGTAFNGPGLMANPNQSLFDHNARYKSALFWRYLAEQRRADDTDGSVAVGTYRKVIEECARSGYTTQAVQRAVADLAGDVDLYRFRYVDGDRELLDSAETMFGNFSLACLLKELRDGIPDRRFDFHEDEELIHFDDALRELRPGIEHVDRLVDVQRRYGSLRATEAVNFSGQVKSLASEYMQISVEAEVDSIELHFTAGSRLSSSIFQVVLVDAGGRIRDILRSDRASYRRRIANEFAGQKLSRLICVVSGGGVGGRYGVTVSPAAPAPDVAITRWNSAVGKEFELPAREAQWSWTSPDLWFTRGANGQSDQLRVFVRLHNKGNAAANNITVALYYRTAADGDWLPVRDMQGTVQRLQGLSLAAGTSESWSVPWLPAQGMGTAAYTLMARVEVPGDHNVDNKLALSNMALADSDASLAAGLALSHFADAGGQLYTIARCTSEIDTSRALRRHQRNDTSRTVTRAMARGIGSDPSSSVPLLTAALPAMDGATPALTIGVDQPGHSARGFTLFRQVGVSGNTAAD